jgi:DNA-binding NarL/FixJ family response regulator
MPIRVVVFDDNQDRRESLNYLLNLQEGFACVGTFADCSDVIRNIAQTTPDVVLMDIEMPRVNGIEGVKKIKLHFPNLPVLMQTVYEDDDHVFDSIKSGASGYLLKKTSPEKIIAAVQEAAEGGAPITPSIALRVLRYFQGKPQAENTYALTEKEKLILALLVDGLSYKMIADKESISYHTVNSHVRRIYEKLHVHSLGEAVGKALRERLV